MSKDKEKSVQKVEKNEAQEKSGVEHISNEKTYVPHVDIYENDKEILLFADMPGTDEKSVDLQLEQNELTISGKVEQQFPESCLFIHREYPVGSFRRVFSVGDSIDKENIQASVKNGTLKVVLPKTAPVSKKIAVTAS